MNIGTEVAQMEARSRESRDRRFSTWMDRAEVRLMISMIPAAERQEALPVLLRAAFDAGAEAGSGEIIGELLAGMMKPKSDRPSGL